MSLDAELAHAAEFDRSGYPSGFWIAPRGRNALILFLGGPVTLSEVDLDNPLSAEVMSVTAQNAS